MDNGTYLASEHARSRKTVTLQTENVVEVGNMTYY